MRDNSWYYYLTIKCCFPSPHSFEHLDHPLITHSFWEMLDSGSFTLETVKLIEPLYFELIWLYDAITTMGPNKGPRAINTLFLCCLFPFWLFSSDTPVPGWRPLVLDRKNLNRVPLVTTLVRSVLITSLPINTIWFVSRSFNVIVTFWNRLNT